MSPNPTTPHAISKKAPEFSLLLGDCLEIMPTLDAESVDAIITDLPYGTTACTWDEVIPFAPMWEQIERVLKNRGGGYLLLQAISPFRVC